MRLVIIQRTGEDFTSSDTTDSMTTWDEIRSILMTDGALIEAFPEKLVISMISADRVNTKQLVLSGSARDIEGYCTLARAYQTEIEERPREPEIMMVRAIERSIGREPLSLNDYGWDEIESLYLIHFGYLE